MSLSGNPAWTVPGRVLPWAAAVRAAEPLDRLTSWSSTCPVSRLWIASVAATPISTDTTSTSATAVRTSREVSAR